jgi:hypothetical protein
MSPSFTGSFREEVSTYLVENSYGLSLLYLFNCVSAAMVQTALHFFPEFLALGSLFVLFGNV